MFPEIVQREILHLKEQGMTDIQVADKLNISDADLQRAYRDIFGFGGIMQDAVKYYYPKINKKYEDFKDLPENNPYVQILRKWWRVHDEMFDKVEQMNIKQVQHALNNGRSVTSIIKDQPVTKEMIKTALSYGLITKG